MDPKLEKALSFANYRETLSNQINAAKEQAKSKLMYSINGGVFVVDRGLISFVEVLISRKQTEAVLLDVNDTPVLIKDLEDFQDDIISRYAEVTNSLLEQYTRLRQSRSVQKLTE